MEITKVKNTNIVSIGYDAMKKTPEKRTDAQNHITVCLAKIIAIGEDKGYRLSLRYSEFFDFIDDIIQRVRKRDCILIISIPVNPPVSMLDRVRTLCDNSLDSITITANELTDTMVVYAVGIKPDHRKEYAIDYAARLL